MYDVLIIGSGPAGLSAAVYAKRSNLNIIVAEKDYMGTGQIAGSVRVDNYLGCPGISGLELGDRFRLHAEEMRVPFYNGNVCSIKDAGFSWRTCFSEGECIESRTVIYAAGTKPRLLNVEGEKKFFGRGVGTCVVCDGPLYKGRTAAVIGGGDTALDSALYLADLCSKVYLIHWRQDFRGNRAILGMLDKKPNVEILRNLAVRRICGGDRVEALELSNGRRLEIDVVFEAVGADPRTELLKDTVLLDPAGYVLAGEDGVTSAEGFFVAGDVRKKRLRQVATAVADGANAAMSAMEYLRRFT